MFQHSALIIEKFEVWQNEDYVKMQIKTWIDSVSKSSALNATFDQLVDFEKEVVSGT